MNTIILSIDTIDQNQVDTIKQVLTQNGVDCFVLGPIQKKFFDYAYDFVQSSCGTAIVLGRMGPFLNYIKNNITQDVNLPILIVDSVKWAFCGDCNSSQFGSDIVPRLYNSKTKYTTIKFGIFGKTEQDITASIAGFGYPKAVVKFDIIGGIEHCELHARISNKLDGLIRTELLNRLTEKFIDSLYSVDGTPLLNQVAKLLKSSGKKIAIAESYTAGGIASKLASLDGASQYLLESVVCYSNQSKAVRLGLDLNELNNSGAISETVAYEMAASIVTQTGCDIAVATTGYASPPISSNAKPLDSRLHKAGRCYLAIGDSKGIRVVVQNFEGDRTEIVQKGVQHAMFEIYKFLRN